MSTVWQINLEDRSTIVEKTARLLEASKAIDWLEEKEAPVLLKPNLVVAKHPREGATTTPAVAEGLIIWLLDHGYNDIRITESSWVGCATDKAFTKCGFKELARRYGVDLVDLKKDDTVTVETHGESLKICRAILENQESGGSFINLPVLKGHGQTYLTCCLKNLKGCIPDSEKRRYHTMGVHRPVALLSTILKPSFALVDGLNGDPGWEEGGSPLERNILLLGRDPLSIDECAAGYLGLDFEDVKHLPMAEKLEIGSRFTKEDLVLIDGQNNRSKHTASSTTVSTRLKKVFEEKIQAEEACSACWGNLISALRNLAGDDPVQAEAFLGSLSGPLSIGQAFKGKQVKNDDKTLNTGTVRLGIGSCTSGFQCHCPGCPPPPEQSAVSFWRIRIEYQDPRKRRCIFSGPSLQQFYHRSPHTD